MSDSTDGSLDGMTVYDVDGERLGTVENTYAGQNGQAQFVRVKIGTLLAKHRLVPVDGAQRADQDLHLPFSKHAVENAPDLPRDVDPRGGMVSEDLRGYYASTTAPQTASTPPTSADTRDTGAPEENIASTPAPTGTATESLTNDDIPPIARATDQESGKVRDRGDVIEIPVIEERLVKQPVVTEVIRVRKTPHVEERMVSADVRREDIEVEEEGDLPGGTRESP